MNEIVELGPNPRGIVTRVEALGFRSLRYVAQELSPFHVLVGPNGSGKSTFLDAIAFVGDVVRAGAQTAIQGDLRLDIPHRAPDGKHLSWLNSGCRIEFALEFSIPEERLKRLKNGTDKVCRYEIGIDVGQQLLQVATETLWIRPNQKVGARQPRQVELFPSSPIPPEHIVHQPRKQTPHGWKKVVSRGIDPSNVTFTSETGNWTNPFRINADKAALASLPEDEDKFPVATWFREALAAGVQRIALSGDAMRRPSPPGRPRNFQPDGSNLPWVVRELETQHPHRFEAWIAHVREALPDLVAITTREREEDRHRYLVVTYENGLEAPSWLVSDGTLRLLALTLLAYSPSVSGTILIEEPENGIHPRAVETVFQSLSSVYGAQILLATHAPVVLGLCDLDQVLCFARTKAGETDIVRGREHPLLRQWKGGADLGTLLAAGVLS